jgi:predicted transcriptional regulator
MANIFIFNKKHDEALKILKEYEKFEEHNFLLSKCKLKIYEMNGQLDKLMDEMKAKYQKHRRNENATKLIEEYF